MGGNALKTMNIDSVRLPKEKYFSVTSEIIKKLCDSKLFTKVHLIDAYRNKSDFGDADILICTKPNVNVSDYIYQAFKVNSINNGECYSFPYYIEDSKCFQVDLIKVTEDIWDMSKVYFGQNDCGNLCGRIFHGVGLKYGHHGLFRKIRKCDIGHKGDSVLEEVLLTTDPHEALSLIGLDANIQLNGFNTLEDMFRWVCSSKYFSSYYFQYENLNNTNHIRNRKRTVYVKFLEFLEQANGDYDKTWRKCGDEWSVDYFNAPEPQIIHLVNSLYPHLESRIAEIKRNYERNLEVREKFNGNIVSELTGLYGKELGDFIQKLKLPFVDFEDFILDSPQEIINAAIKQYFQTYKRAYYEPSRT